MVANAANDPLAARDLKYILDYLGTDGSDIHWSLIRLALGSHRSCGASHGEG